MRVLQMAMAAALVSAGFVGTAAAQTAAATPQPTFVAPKATAPLAANMASEAFPTNNFQSIQKLSSGELQALYSLQLVKRKAMVNVADNKACFKMRSYNYASDQPASDSPRYTGETTCTPASAGRVKKLTVTPTPAPVTAK